MVLQAICYFILKGKKDKKTIKKRELGGIS